MGKKFFLVSSAVCFAIIAAIAVYGVINAAGGVSGDEKALWKLAASCEARGDIVKARDAYRKIVDIYPGSKSVEKAQAKKFDLNMKILFSPVMADEASEYIVLKGDNLTKIAKKFGTTVGLIMASNGMKSAEIMPGQKLKVFNARLSILVDKSQNTLTLKTNDRVIKVYRVSTGANNKTPTGEFKVEEKIVNPVWYTAQEAIQPGDPRNILGTRWLGISKESYGIHGTTDPGSIGKSVSAGCVRLANPDVEELFTIVPEGTEVVIVE